MLLPLLILVLIGCVGLVAAIRPEAYIHYFLAEVQRKALSRNLRAVSLTGWAIFCGCMAVAVALAFRTYLGVIAPVVSPLFFIICAVAYFWWGIALMRHPESFLKRTVAPFNRAPAVVVKGFGALLVVGGFAFLYGFFTKLVALAR